MSSWINRTVLSGSSTAANGTNTHTCTFTAATAGNLLVAVMGGAVTFTTPTGWTLVNSAVNTAGLYVFTKTAASGESSFTTTHNGTNYPIEGVVYEYAAGSSVLNSSSSTTSGYSLGNLSQPQLTGLTGTYTRYTTYTQNVQAAAGSASYAWTTPTIKDYDAYNNTGTDGVSLTIAYDDGATGSSFTPSAVITSSNAQGSVSGISFALSVTLASTYPPGSMSWLYFLNSADETLFQDLVAFYNFDGNTVDTSGQGNDANTSGTFTTTTDHHGLANGAYTFNGTNSYMTTTNSLNSPQDYSANVWFKTTSNGGVMLAFTNTQTGTGETNYDRIVWVDTTGHVNFGVWIGSAHYITSPGTYFDGNWHMATATMSSTTGMGLYVDGVSVATDPNTTSQVYSGWWRIGQSATGSWPNTMRSFFTGSLDDVRIYSVALNATQVAELYTL